MREYGLDGQPSLRHSKGPNQTAYDQPKEGFSNGGKCFGAHGSDSQGPTCFIIRQDDIRIAIQVGVFAR